MSSRFLRSGAGDVVTSLSAGNTFPDHELALHAGTWQPSVSNTGEPWDELEALWDRLPADDQWERCTRALGTRPFLQWRPGGGDYVFGDFTIQQPAGLVPAHHGSAGSPEGAAAGAG